MWGKLFHHVFCKYLYVYKILLSSKFAFKIGILSNKQGLKTEIVLNEVGFFLWNLMKKKNLSRIFV